MASLTTDHAIGRHRRKFAGCPTCYPDDHRFEDHPTTGALDLPVPAVVPAVGKAKKADGDDRPTAGRPTGGREDGTKSDRPSRRKADTGTTGSKARVRTQNLTAPVGRPTTRKARAKALAAAIDAAPEPLVTQALVEGALDVTVIPTGPVTREAWMLAAVELFRPEFADAEAPVGEVRVSIGWPGGRGSSEAVGQCWMPESVEDGQPAIFVSPVQHEPVEILETILHEMVHASGRRDHNAAFGKIARYVGLTPPWRKHPMTKELRAKLTPIADKLGPFPHAKIREGVDRLGAGRKVQGTRMLKVRCDQCGCVIRMTRKWLTEAGAPTCGCGTEMAEVRQ